MGLKQRICVKSEITTQATKKGDMRYITDSQNFKHRSQSTTTLGKVGDKMKFGRFEHYFNTFVISLKNALCFINF